MNESRSVEAQQTGASKVVWVITWKYQGDSGSGVIRAYSDRKRAEEDMEMLEDYEGCGKSYEIHEMPLYSSSA